jgi:putative transposase
MDRFQESCGAKYPKAVEKRLRDRKVLLTHYQYPAEHWIRLRTTNAIESTFAAVRLRTKNVPDPLRQLQSSSEARPFIEPAPGFRT